eukprot:gene8260-8448_t
MIVSDEQIPAAQVLLSFIYTSTVPAGLSQHDLLQLLLLADRFDVRRAAAAASRVLGCLSPAALEWATLTGIWGLPDHLFEADEQQPLQVVAWDRLMQLFGDLEDSWATADGRSLWQQLPLRAVTALAASDALAVANENTVFAALSSWIAHAQSSIGSCQGRQLSAQDLKLEITQTRGATGFDCSKPWALGVFLTCQVRTEVPSRAEHLSAGPAYADTGSGSGSGGSAAGGGAAAGGAGAGQATDSMGSTASKCQDGPAGDVGSHHHHQLQQPPPLGMQVVDFGFVSTAASISVREAGGSKDKRCEKSWEHAVCTGWDESAFERWVVDGQMHLQAVVRVLG